MTNKTNKNVLVIGAGSFGTSLAYVCSKNFEKVILKVRDQKIYKEISQTDRLTIIKRT